MDLTGENFSLVFIFDSPHTSPITEFHYLTALHFLAESMYSHRYLHLPASQQSSPPLAENSFENTLLHYSGIFHRQRLSISQLYRVFRSAARGGKRVCVSRYRKVIITTTFQRITFFDAADAIIIE